MSIYMYTCHSFQKLISTVILSHHYDCLGSAGHKLGIYFPACEALVFLSQRRLKKVASIDYIKTEIGGGKAA